MFTKGSTYIFAYTKLAHTYAQVHDKYQDFVGVRLIQLLPQYSSYLNRNELIRMGIPYMQITTT